MDTTKPLDVIEMGTRLSIVDEQFMAAYLKDTDPADWWRVDAFVDEVKERAIALWQQIANFTYSKHTKHSPIHKRHKAMTANDWPGFRYIKKYQVQGGANLFLFDVLQDALNHANAAALDLCLTYMGIPEDSKNLFPREAKATAELWALQILEFKRKSDPTFPTTIDELYEDTKARVTPEQWSHIERQIRRKASEPMAKQQAIPETKVQRWCDDPDTWKMLCESTRAALVGDHIEFADIEDVMFQICGAVGGRSEIICSKDEFYKLRAEWVKENKPQIEKTIDSEFPRDPKPVEVDDNPTGRINPLHGNPNPAPTADEMPEPGPTKKNTWASTSGGKFYDSAKNYISNIDGLPEKMGLTDEKSYRLFVLKAWDDGSGKPITSLTLCPDQSYNAAWQTLVKYVADMREMLSNYGGHLHKNSNGEQPNIGQLWGAVESRFEKRGLLIKTWLNGRQFGEAISGKTFDQVIDEVEQWMNDFVASTKKNIEESKGRQEASKKAEHSTKPQALLDTSTDEEQENVSQNPPAEPAKEITIPESQPQNKVIKFEPTEILTESVTLTGIPLSQLAATLNRPYQSNDPSNPNDVPYRSIKGPGGKNWTDLKGNYVRDRFDKVFGPMGIGWKISPHPTLSKITCIPDQEKAGNGTRDGFTVTMENYVFQYSIVVNGQLMWVDGPCVTDSNFSADRSYAYRGCMTSIMKQALRAFGGFNHFIGKAS